MEDLWHSLESDFTTSAQANVLYNDFKNYTFEIAVASLRTLIQYKYAILPV